MFLLSLHGSIVFKGLSFCGNSSHGKLVHGADWGIRGLLGFVPLKAAVETSIKLIFKCSCAAELSHFFKNGDSFLQVSSTGSRNKITFAVV